LEKVDIPESYSATTFLDLFGQADLTQEWPIFPSEVDKEPKGGSACSNRNRQTLGCWKLSEVCQGSCSESLLS